MKVIGQNSVASIIKTILDIAWVIYVVGAILVVISTVFSFFPVFFSPLKGIVALTTGFGKVFFMLVSLMVIKYLKEVFQTLMEEKPFEEGNPEKIRKVGFLLMLLTISNGFGFLFAGGVVLVVAEIYKLGTEAFNEQKLTV